MSTKSAYQRFLIIGGLLLAVAGIITWIVAGGNLAPATWYDDAGAIASATAWIWAGIIATAIGVVLIIAFIVVRAATGEPEVEVDRPSLTQRMRERAAEDRQPVASDVSERLEKLADLHAQGALSDEEFAAAKARALS